MNIRDFNRFLHSRWLFLLMGLLMAASMLPAWFTVTCPTGAVVNMAMTVGLALLMSLLNRTFNLLKAPTALDASLFLLMSMSTPGILLSFSGGTAMCLVAVVCLFILYSTYGNGHASRPAFSIFLILSAASTVRLCFAVYIPVFFIGLAQMRALNGRTATASLLGLITPWWILGAAYLTVPDFAWFDFNNLRLEWPNLALDGPWLLAAAVTAVLLLGGWVLNIPQMIGYNAHSRAYNGTTSVMALATVICTAIFAADVFLFLPALYMCAAFQLGRLLAGRAPQFSVAAAMVAIIVYILVYLCNLANLLL